MSMTPDENPQDATQPTQPIPPRTPDATAAHSAPQQGFPTQQNVPAQATAPAQVTAPQAAGPQAAVPQPGPMQPGAPQTASFQTPPAQPQPPKSRTGALLAGLAAGALLGGVVGGGVAAVVAANTSAPAVVQAGGGTLTLSNSETATAISGVAAVATPSVVTVQVSSETAAGSGSGVIISEDGYIVTNAHVVTLDGEATNADVVIKLSDGRLFQAQIVGVDPFADLAVVKVEADSLPAVQFADSSELNVGDLTVAIGAPMSLSNTVTSGVVSAVYRGISVGSPLIPEDPSAEEELPDNGSPWDFRFGTPDEQQQQQQQSSFGTVTIPVVQTDASINPGNSGGALLNGNGELIGINVAIASPTSSNGVAGSDGLGFAIPADLVQRVADALIAGEQPSHGLLGASVGDSTQVMSEGVSRAGGLVQEVVSGGAAESAGLRAGDVITAVNGIPANDGTTVSALIRMAEGESDVTIDFLRDGREQQTTATLGTLDW